MTSEKLYCNKNAESFKIKKTIMKELKKYLFTIIGASIVLFSCKKKEQATPKSTLSPSATHTLHVTTNAFGRAYYLNGTEMFLDANYDKTFTAKGGDSLRAVYDGGFMSLYIDALNYNTPTVSSTGYSGTLKYTFK